jgi:hypothetical protein
VTILFGCDHNSICQLGIAQEAYIAEIVGILLKTIELYFDLILLARMERVFFY